MRMKMCTPFGHFQTTSNKLYIGKPHYDLNNIESYGIIYIRRNTIWYCYGKYNNSKLCEVLLSTYVVDEGELYQETTDYRNFYFESECQLHLS